MSSFAERFSELKTAHNFTFPYIAAQLNLTPRMVKSYAAGTAKPSYNALIALADLFDVSLDYLCGRSDVKERR